MTPALRRNPVSLSAETTEQIKRALIGGLSFWGSRTSTISVEELEQPFFKSWKILEVVSPSPLPDIRAYLAWKPGSTPGGQLLLLSGVPQHLHEVATSEPPRGLADDQTAESYAWNASSWISDAMLRDFRLDSVTDLPWLSQLKPEETAVKDELTREARITPPKTQRTAQGFELHYFLVNNKRLIERTIRVPPDGLLTRKDAVLREGLAVPPGRVWKMLNGRPRPVG